MKTLEDVVWLVWSAEHCAWWKPGHHGYTINLEEAGRYSLAQAVDICARANIAVGWGSQPNEVMTPCPTEVPGYSLEGVPGKQAYYGI